MYVDKRLKDIQAVQTLSRLNRTHPGKEDTFVLDFVNDIQEILEAFQPYYEQTNIGERAEPHQLYELQARLDAQQVYYKAEVEEFSKVFYKPAKNQTSSDHAKMNACIDPAVTRFKQLGKDTLEEFRKVLVAYRNLYAFLSQIIPFQDSDLEKLYSYIRFLLIKLPRLGTGDSYNLDDEVALEYYKLQKISEGAIELKAGGEVDGPTSVGTGISHEEKIELSQLIDIEDAVSDTNLRQAAMANTMENFGYVFLKALEGLFIDRMDLNEEMTAKYMNEKEFQKIAGQNLLERVYKQIRSEEAYA